MEPEESLPHSQVPATGPYLEPARSSPYPHIQFHEDKSLYYPPIYAWVSQAVSFPQFSPPKPCIRLSSPLYVLHAPLISFSILRGYYFTFKNRILGARKGKGKVISLQARCGPEGG